jgi:hypothetical protein
MAQAPQNPGGDANFIRQIVSDPKNVPDVTLLTGYLGASSEEGHERLYLSPDLSNYVEIPKAAILHQAPLPAEQDAHGGVTLWVKKDAALQYKMAPAAQALANYFAGAIQAGAQGAAPAPRATPPQTMRDCTLAPALCAATAVGPGCQSFHVGTCIVQCNPTLFGPQCPFPTEVTCAPVCHRTFAPACAASPAPACGPNITFGGCSVACFPGQFPGEQGQVAAAVRAAPQSIGVCGQSVGADCTAADLCTVNQCPSQFATCMPVQTCIPNVCTVDSICCQTAFAICPPTPVNPCVSAGATCAPNCTHGFVCLVSRFELACQFTVNPRACQIHPVASGPACPPPSLGCPVQSAGCDGFPGQGGFAGQDVQQQGFEWSVMCTMRCWHTGRYCWV